MGWFDNDIVMSIHVAGSRTWGMVSALVPMGRDRLGNLPQEHKNIMGQSNTVHAWTRPGMAVFCVCTGGEPSPCQGSSSASSQALLPRKPGFRDKAAARLWELSGAACRGNGLFILNR